MQPPVNPSFAHVDTDGTLDTKIYTVTASADTGVTIADFST